MQPRIIPINRVEASGAKIKYANTEQLGPTARISVRTTKGTESISCGGGWEAAMTEERQEKPQNLISTNVTGLPDYDRCGCPVMKTRMDRSCASIVPRNRKLLVFEVTLLRPRLHCRLDYSFCGLAGIKSNPFSIWFVMESASRRHKRDGGALGQVSKSQISLSGSSRFGEQRGQNVSLSLSPSLYLSSSLQSISRFFSVLLSP